MKSNRATVKVAALAILIGSVGMSTGAQQRRSLHDRAQQNGGRLVEKFKADRSSAFPNLEELARRSNAIVVGRALTNRARLTSDGDSITTDFSIVVQESIKGALRLGSVVVVSLPGGAHRFEDGVTAFLYAANYRPARNGRSYVFFLDRHGPVSRGWVLTGGIQGQFEMDFATEKIIPAGTAGQDPLVDRYKDKTIRSFLVELHQAAGNHRH